VNGRIEIVQNFVLSYHSQGYDGPNKSIFEVPSNKTFEYSPSVSTLYSSHFLFQFSNSIFCLNSFYPWTSQSVKPPACPSDKPKLDALDIFAGCGGQFLGKKNFPFFSFIDAVLVHFVGPVGAMIEGVWLPRHPGSPVRIPAHT
jgi:hypothetical protein